MLGGVVQARVAEYDVASMGDDHNDASSTRDRTTGLLSGNRERGVQGRQPSGPHRYDQLVDADVTGPRASPRQPADDKVQQDPEEGN